MGLGSSRNRKISADCEIFVHASSNPKLSSYQRQIHHVHASDIRSLHTHSSPTTFHTIGAKEIVRMHKRAHQSSAITFINFFRLITEMVELSLRMFMHAMTLFLPI